MATVIKPPTKLINIKRPTLFLAGSIEMGQAVNWQIKVENSLPDNITVFNPRRDDWDASWKQDKDCPQFREQVEWELSALEMSDLVILYFDPATKSPISLLELGLFHHKMIVCCPDGFWRKGNVDIVCERYAINQLNTLDEIIETSKRYISYLE